MQGRACARRSDKTSNTARVPAGVAAAGLPGEWMDAESGAIVYRIARGSDGTYTIAVPCSDAWRVVFKNVRFDGAKLMFDQYWYVPASSDFKTISNPAGEHPFSGVRCETTLEVDKDNRDVATVTVKTVHTPQGIAERLSRRRREGDGGRPPDEDARASGEQE